MTLLTHCVPEPVFCVVHERHRDLAVADEVLQGRFTMGGRTLTLGLDPDWTADPCREDKEWRVDWVKFYFGLDLAHAWGVTGRRAYLAAWEHLVRTYIAQVPPGADETEVVARRIQNWIYAWNRFEQAGRGTPVVDPALAADLTTYVWTEVAHVRAHLSAERNHRTLELYALLVAARAFPSCDPAHEWRRFALEALHLNLLTDVRPDGVHWEASTHYHCVALRSWLGAWVQARESGVAMPVAYTERLIAACEFAVAAHRPDGRIPACSDADAESYRDVLALAAEVFSRDDWRFVASGGREGCVPRRPDASFPEGGYYVQRSGWGRDPGTFRDQRYLIFDCGPLGDGGHGHYDALSVEVFAGGQPLLVDPGRYSYSEAGENWRRYFKGTAAHNTVVVDALDQTPYQRRKPKGPVATATCLARATAPCLDVMMGEVRSPAYDAVHTRSVLFVAGEYWVVVDRLVASRPHHYQLRWHLSPDAGGGLTADASGLVHGNGLTLAFSPSSRVRFESGWVSPRYGVKHPAPIVVVDARARTTSFVTVIDPRGREPGRPPTTVGFLSRGERSGERTILDVRGAGPDGRSSDLISWSARQDVLELADFSGVARAAWIRRGPDEQPAAFAAADVTDATWHRRDGVESMGVTDGTAWIAWRSDVDGGASWSGR